MPEQTQPGGVQPSGRTAGEPVKPGSVDEPQDATGLLVVDKPSGCTSHDVVDRVRRAFAMERVGHSGTLDPDATGVLLVGLGKATRLLNFLQNLPKSYRATVKFGVSTTSGDRQGRVVGTTESALTLEQVQEVAGEFWGEIQQIPPMVSAVKVGGEPLYKAARRGEVVERAARTVRIYQIDFERFDEAAQTAQISVRCSSGTYIRTLATDIGDRLGVGAHLTSLRRLSIGSFGESESTPLENLEKMGRSELAAKVLAMGDAMRDFPRVTVDAEHLHHVAHGRPLPDAAAAGRSPGGLAGGPPGGGLVPQRKGELPVLSRPRSGDRPAHEAGMTAGIPVAVLNPEGELIAVYRRSAKELKPAAVLI